VLKNTIETPPPERQRAAPKPPRAPPPATAAQKPRPPAERLAGETLDRTLGQLSQTLLYPPEAVRRGLEGEVVVMLELDAAGRIVAASVASGSGHAILDEAALRAARQLGALGPSVGGKAVLLPVRFRLL
jgi:protein TonB